MNASGCIFVNGQYTEQFVLFNKKTVITGSFTAIKINILTGAPLPGAEFTLSKGGQVIATTISTD